MEHERPKVGVAVLIEKDGKVLLGRRLGDDKTKGMFGTPGGHVEHLESLTESAVREVEEETGIEIENVRFLSVVNVREFAPWHFIMIVLHADWKAGEPLRREPDKCEGWAWFGFDELPDPMTPATVKGILAFQNTQTMFE